MLYKEMLLIGEDYDYFIEMDPAGNGEQGLITDLGSATLQQVISYCDII